MDPRTIVILLSTILLGSTAQVLLKYGVVSVGGVHLDRPQVGEITKVITSIPILLGLLTYVMSSYLTLVSLSRVPLSVFSPFMALNFVLVLAASYFLFQESIGSTRLIGFVLIIVGVVLVGRS